MIKLWYIVLTSNSDLVEEDENWIRISDNRPRSQISSICLVCGQRANHNTKCRQEEDIEGQAGVFYARKRSKSLHTFYILSPFRFGKHFREIIISG